MNPKDKKGPKILDPTNVCERCKVKSGTAPHRCPLSVALDDDWRPCNCCHTCEGQCVMEV